MAVYDRLESRHLAGNGQVLFFRLVQLVADFEMILMELGKLHLALHEFLHSSEPQ